MNTADSEQAHSIDVANALKQRFESDALLGASELPVRIPDPASIPVMSLQPVSEEETKRRRVQLDIADTVTRRNPCSPQSIIWSAVIGKSNGGRST